MITMDNIWNRDSNESEFIRAYLECALWSSTDDDDIPLDQEHDTADFAPCAIESAIAECRAFMSRYSGLFNGNYEQAGHDFWLTRNSHGAGFWDRPEIYGKSNAETLTNACGFHTCFYERWLYKGDDGLLYFM